MLSLSFLAFLSAFPAALLIAAFNDLYEFKIPNWVSLLLVGSYFATGFALRAPASLMFEGMMVSAGALVVGFVLFARNTIGGGDAKLFSATILWVGLSGLAAFLVNMAIAGGLLAVFLLLFRKSPPLAIYARAPWLFRLHQTPKDIPYAVAICAGGLLSFPQTHYFQLAFGG